VSWFVRASRPVWRFCVADEGGWLRFEMDSAESNRDT
jgi:hypothetical protein